MPEPALSELARKCKRKRETGHRVPALVTKPKLNPDPSADTNPTIKTISNPNACRNLDAEAQVSVAGSSRRRRLTGHKIAALLRQFEQEEDSYLSWEHLI